MHRNEYRRMAHEEVEEIFREILPQAGMKVREEQITLCHQMLSSLCGNKIALCDAAVGVGKTYALRNSIRWLQRAEDLLIGNLSRWTKNRLEESREVLLQFLNVDRNNILFLRAKFKSII